MIDQLIYAVLLIASGQALKSYPATPELGVFTMMMVIAVAAFFGVIEEMEGI